VTCDTVTAWSQQSPSSWLFPPARNASRCLSDGQCVGSRPDSSTLLSLGFIDFNAGLRGGGLVLSFLSFLSHSCSRHLLPLFLVLFLLLSSGEFTFSLCPSLSLSLCCRGLHRSWVVLGACAFLIRFFG
jgi:hypothetical protein